MEEDFVRGINFYYAKGFPYYKQFGYWGADVRPFVLPYMGLQGDNAWIRLILNYTSNDWVFFEKVTIAADDERFYIYCDYFDVVRDNDWNDIWEYLDVAVGDYEMEILNAIADSSKTVVRFEGDNYYDDFTVTAADKQAIREMLDAYAAFAD